MEFSKWDALRRALGDCLAHFRCQETLSAALRLDWYESYSLNVAEINPLAELLFHRSVFRIAESVDAQVGELHISHPERAQFVAFRRQYDGLQVLPFTDEARDQAKSFLSAWLDWAMAGRPPSPVETAVLSDRQNDILDTLYDLRAVAPDAKMTTEDVAERLNLDPAALKEPASLLAKAGFVRTKRGRGGGLWLTELGRTRVESRRKR